MSDSTKQFNWIVTIKLGCEALFKADPTVLVAGDLLWYSVEGSNTIKAALDTMVVFGRLKGEREKGDSYLQAEISLACSTETCLIVNSIGLVTSC